MHLLKGESATNVILFLAVILTAIILITWYAQAIRPTRTIIATVTDDIQELDQHLRNACSVTEYRASYLMQTPNAHIFGNTTHLCIVTEVFGSCTRTPCPIEGMDLPRETQPVLSIEKTDGPARIAILGS